jgi:hypothetical protein
MSDCFCSPNQKDCYEKRDSLSATDHTNCDEGIKHFPPLKERRVSEVLQQIQATGINVYNQEGHYTTEKGKAD